MTKAEVIALLKANRDERGIRNWEKLGADTEGQSSFGIGLTRLRKIAKQVGRDHGLALQLWNADIHDAKIVGLLIDDPQKMTRQQAEEQVEGVGAGMLSHVFSSCDATLSKTPFAFELAQAWIKAKHTLRKQCGYGLVYELSKDKRNQHLTDEFFLDCIERIQEGTEQEVGPVKLAMGGALMGIGKRNRKLNQAAVKVAEAIGPIDDGESDCQPMDVLEHLRSDHLQRKLGA